MNLRALARDQDCRIRLSGICNGDPATTVLAHVRMNGISGMGMKSPDLFAAFACFACHSAIDRRSHKSLDRDYVRLAHLEGVIRTQAWLLERGYVRVGK
jgi:hypothetical protein